MPKARENERSFFDRNTLRRNRNKKVNIIYAQIAQSVEQRTENPRVGGSIPPLGTTRTVIVLVFLYIRLFTL